MVFENRVLKVIFVPRRDKMTGERNKLYKEELGDLFISPSIIRIIRSRSVRWAGHIA
jgi:hypothetical protein